jgi:MoaA/NifB/PqqE/SkfB family radical SAM enzyme
VDKYLNSNICHLPWTSLETRPDGRYKPCCLYREELKDSSGKKYNTTEHSISEVMNSDAMENLRKQFLNGEKPVSCSSCWKEEAVGKTSKRQHMWLKAGTYGEVQIKNNIIEPRFIDLKLGNICNLKCRICSPQSSSQWTNDMIKLDPNRKDYWKKFNRDGLWPRQPNKFYEDLEKHIHSIRFFEITGGEPLMIKEQFSVLRKCVEAGVANKIEIHYNTNGTQYPEEAVKDIWPHFKRVEIAFSIDDIEKRFEYQRHPAVWSEVDANIKKFMNSGLKNLSTQICTTLNFFNIWNIDELAYKVKEWNPNFWYINILHHPVEFDIQQIPRELKVQIIDKLKKTEIYQQEIQTAIDYINGEPDYRINDWKKALTEKIKSIDLVREENFSKTFEHLNNLLKIYE